MKFHWQKVRCYRFLVSFIFLINPIYLQSIKQLNSRPISLFNNVDQSEQKAEGTVMWFAIVFAPTEAKNNCLRNYELISST